ncbi:MAG: hypothetical protein QM771_10765 [Nitrospira sp.]
MKTRPSLRWGACLVLVSAAGMAQPAQAGDHPDAAIVAQRKLPITIQRTDGAPGQLGTEAPSTGSMASVTPECDGQSQSAGVLGRLLNRLKGKAVPEEAGLCQVFLEEGTEEKLHE